MLLSCGTPGKKLKHSSFGWNYAVWVIVLGGWWQAGAAKCWLVGGSSVWFHYRLCLYRREYVLSGLHSTALCKPFIPHFISDGLFSVFGENAV